MSGRVQRVVIAALAVTAVASAAVAVTQMRRADSVRRSNSDLEQRLDEAEKRLADLDEEAEVQDPLGDLLGESDGGLGDLLGGSDLSDLLGGGSAGLLECLAGGGGGSASIDGLLGDIASGGSAVPEKALEGLFGGLGGGSAGGPARSQMP
jgi:hypothetical protein